MLHHVRFEHNAALGATSLAEVADTGRAIAQGKGGAIFILPEMPLDGERDDTTEDSNPPPSVIVLGDPPVFIHNTATHARGQPTDNNDIYGELSLVGER